MSRYTRNRSQNVTDLYEIIIYILFFIISIALAIAGCGTDEEGTQDNGGGTTNTAGNSSVGNAGSGSETGTSTEQTSGVDPANPCVDPTIYNVNDLQSLKDCTTISGNLELSQKATEVTDLSGLTNLTAVEGDLDLFGPNLSNIQGLSNLTSVGGKLTVMTSKVTTLDGLNNLVSVGALYLYNCKELTDLSGLGSLTSINGDLYIRNNEDNANYALTSLTGFQSLTSISGEIFILNVKGIPTCEFDTLFDQLSLDETQETSVKMCGTAKDDCGGGEAFCDIQT